VTEYSPETGKAIKIREYADTTKGLELFAAHGS
jgi:hypothetical protein